MYKWMSWAIFLGSLSFSPSWAKDTKLSPPWNVPPVNKFRSHMFSSQIVNGQETLVPQNSTIEGLIGDQEIIDFDIEKFIGENDDFVSAAKSFVMDLEFDSQNYQYKKPYPGLLAWGTLFHSPLKKIEIPIEKVDSQLGGGPNYRNSKLMDPSFQQRLDRETNSDLTKGNSIALLQDNESKKNIISVIDEAQKYVFGVFLTASCDDDTKEIIDALIKKSRQGVDVRLALDGFFSNLDNVGPLKGAMANCHEKLKEAGVDIVKVGSRAFAKGTLHSSYILNDKDHMVFGSQSLTETFMGSTGFNYLDRDMMADIRGPVVTDTLGDFLNVTDLFANPEKNRPIDGNGFEYRNLYQKKRLDQIHSGLRMPKSYDNWLKTNTPSGLCRLVSQRRNGESRGIEKLLGEYIKNSSSRITGSSVRFSYPMSAKDRANPYNRSALNLKKLLVKAALMNDVKVHLLGNGIDGGEGELTMKFNQWKDGAKQEDTWGNWAKLKSLKFTEGILLNKVKKAAKQFTVYKDLTAYSNITIWTYFNFLHHKTWSFDRIAHYIGSLNFEEVAFEKQYDTGVICMDENLRTQFEFQWARDIVNSVPYFKGSMK